MNRGRILLALAFSIGLTQAAAGQTLKLRYGQAPSAAKSIFSLPITVAEREDFFKREGVDVEIVMLIPGGADRMVVSLHQGDVDLVHIATAFLVRAAMGGSDVVAVTAEFDNPIYSLVAKPEIKTIEDLKGKVIGL